jgi:hypothetical protein
MQTNSLKKNEDNNKKLLFLPLLHALLTIQITKAKNPYLGGNFIKYILIH